MKQDNNDKRKGNVETNETIVGGYTKKIKAEVWQPGKPVTSYRKIRRWPDRESTNAADRKF